MVETDIVATSPWTGTFKGGRGGRAAGEAGVTLTESRPCATALLSLRRGRGPDVTRAAATVGVALPDRPRWVEARGLTVLWAGPGQWLLRRPGTFAAIETDVAGWMPGATLIDQSHSRAVLTIGGPRVRDALAKGFEIDLHPRAFATGDVAMTVAAGVSAWFWQRDDRPTYEIAVPRSMAGSFGHWLEEASAEYGCMVNLAT